MHTSIDFLEAIEHTDRVYIRCLSPKNTSQLELAARGMTYTNKSGVVKKSTVNGCIDLQTGEFYRRYGNYAGRVGIKDVGIALQIADNYNGVTALLATDTPEKLPALLTIEDQNVDVEMPPCSDLQISF
jgi:hypothetical protein